MKRIAIPHRMPWQPWAAARDKLALARAMRKAPTESEAVLWSALRCRQLDGFKFRRQHIIAGYIVDFYCPALQLAVEIDGPIHIRRRAADRERTTVLQALGVTLLRLTAEQVLEHLPEALHTISAQCRRLADPRESWDVSPHPYLPPQTGEGEQNELWRQS
jgi:very-short-patch-repair endonuclease